MYPHQAKEVINITIPVSHDGAHYHGVCLLDGVSFHFEKAPCQPSDAPVRYMAVFDNAKEDVKPIFVDQISHIDDKTKRPVLTYLLLHPKA